MGASPLCCRVPGIEYSAQAKRLAIHWVSDLPLFPGFGAVHKPVGWLVASQVRTRSERECHARSRVQLIVVRNRTEPDFGITKHDIRAWNHGRMSFELWNRERVRAMVLKRENHSS